MNHDHDKDSAGRIARASIERLVAETERMHKLLNAHRASGFDDGQDYADLADSLARLDDLYDELFMAMLAARKANTALRLDVENARGARITMNELREVAAREGVSWPTH